MSSSRSLRTTEGTWQWPCRPPENLVLPVTLGCASLRLGPGWTPTPHRARPGTRPARGALSVQQPRPAPGDGVLPPAAWPVWSCELLRAGPALPVALSLEPRAAHVSPVLCGFSTGRSLSFLTSGEGIQISLLTLLPSAPRWALRRFVPVGDTLLLSCLLFWGCEACAVDTRC